MTAAPLLELAPHDHAPRHHDEGEERTSDEERRVRLALPIPSTNQGDLELLAECLGRGGDGRSARSLACSLLESFGGLTRLSRATPRALTRHAGIGRAQAGRLAAAFELGRRAVEYQVTESLPTPVTLEGLARWAQPRLGGLEHEEVWALALDARGGLKAAHQVARGGLHGCGLVPRDLFTVLVREASSGFVLLHNHPSGDPTPSYEDVALTRAVQSAAELLGIHFVDHVVVSRTDYRSVFDSCFDTERPR